VSQNQGNYLCEREQIKRQIKIFMEISRKTLSRRAFILVELVCNLCSMVKCLPTWKFFEPDRSGLFMEALSNRRDGILTPFSGTLPF
jgi:hypothetical protein